MKRLAAAAVVVLVLGLVWWFALVPHWRPQLDDGERYGIDVSAHQGRIDWQAVAGDEIGFAYIKATEGGDHTGDWAIWQLHGRARVEGIDGDVDLDVGRGRMGG